MSCSVDQLCCASIVGEPFIQQVNGCDIDGNPIKVGVPISLSNATMNFQIETSEKSVKNYKSTKGGNFCSFTDITKVSVTIGAKCLKDVVLQLALASNSEEITLPVTGEIHLLASTGDLLNSRVFLDNLVDISVAATVDNVTQSVTLVAGTDYVLTKTGIKIISLTNVAPGDQLEFSYTPMASTKHNIGEDITKEFEVVLDGVDKISKKKIYVKIYRAKLAANGLNLVSDDDFLSVELTGEAYAGRCCDAEEDLVSSLDDYGIFVYED